MRTSRNKDTLEQIVLDAIKREKEINKQHPERHGYGMIKGEADDLIYRIRKLEKKEELNQQVKGDRLTERIKIVNCDKLYSRSPETIAIENIYKENVNKAEKKFFRELSDRNKQIYNMKDQGNKFVDIGKTIGLHVSNVSRNYYKDLDKLRNELNKILNEE